MRTSLLSAAGALALCVCCYLTPSVVLAGFEELCLWCANPQLDWKRYRNHAWNYWIFEDEGHLVFNRITRLNLGGERGTRVTFTVKGGNGRNPETDELTVGLRPIFNTIGIDIEGIPFRLRTSVREYEIDIVLPNGDVKRQRFPADQADRPALPTSRLDRLPYVEGAVQVPPHDGLDAVVFPVDSVPAWVLTLNVLNKLAYADYFGWTCVCGPAHPTRAVCSKPGTGGGGGGGNK